MTTATAVRSNPLQEVAFKYRSIIHAIIAFVSVFILVVPALWLVLASFKTPQNLFLIPPQIIPDPFTLDNYIEALSSGNFPRYLANSLFVTTISSTICVVFGALAAYALTFLKFKGQRIWQGVIVGTQFFPTGILLLPLFRMWAQLGLFDTYVSLIATYTATSLALCTWLLVGFYRAIPPEVLDAAVIDGCDQIGLLVRIILPLSLPGLLASGAFVFIGVWQELLLAVTLIGDPALRTVMVGLYSFITEHRIAWNLLIAASVAVSVPTIIIFGLVQRYIVDGVTSGALK
ncbi:MAG: sugar ABC transporter permease [Anaerolineaceae bacterium]|nr:sugar ABC transporter permease [Anaerolineaceae bacterium]